MVTKRIILGVLLATGCAVSASEPGRDAPTDSAKDTRGAEVPTAPSPAPTTELEAPVLSWGFEPASADCNGWPVLGADAIRASPARSGAYSCKLCSNGSAEGLSLVHDVGSVPAGRYVLTAWVRKRVQNAAPGEALARIDAQTGSGDALSAVAPTVAVREEWDRLETTIDLKDGASNLRLTVGSASAEIDHCLFIDDVSIVRER